LGFGTDPAYGHYSFLDILLDGHVVSGHDLSSVKGDVTFSTGPLLSLTTTEDEGVITGASYEFGPGLFSFTAVWAVSDTSTESGGFTAILQSLSVNTQEGAIFGGLATGEFTAILGPGLFDHALANFLGVSQLTSGGLAVGGLDLIEGDPSSPTRLAGAPDAWVVNIYGETAVPEPSLTGLALIATALSVVRRRFQNQQRRRSEVNS
jgi:hypothetical protein